MSPVWLERCTTLSLLLVESPGGRPRETGQIASLFRSYHFVSCSFRILVTGAFYSYPHLEVSKCNNDITLGRGFKPAPGLVAVPGRAGPRRSTAADRGGRPGPGPHGAVPVAAAVGGQPRGRGGVPVPPLRARPGGRDAAQVRGLALRSPLVGLARCRVHVHRSPYGLQRVPRLPVERREERGRCVCCRKAFQQYVAQDEFFLSAFSHAFERAIVRAAGDSGIQAKLRELLEGVRKELLLHEAFAKVRFEICCVELSLAGLIAAILLMSGCACRKGHPPGSRACTFSRLRSLHGFPAISCKRKGMAGPMHTAITVVSGVRLHRILQVTLCQISGYYVALALVAAGHSHLCNYPV